MALTLGLIVVFFAAVAVAYFAGLHASRSSAANLPQRSPSNNTSDLKSKSGSEATEIVSPIASKQAPICASDCDAATGPPAGDEDKTTDTELSDTRRFQRSAFSGTASATIYPPKQQLDGEPVRCEVMTRDLCCGGIGIAHTQRLLPQQMIVLEAVGKLLVGEVRWCQRVDKNLYMIGCRLIKTTV
jgi:hypothetical protein